MLYIFTVLSFVLLENKNIIYIYIYNTKLSIFSHIEVVISVYATINN